MARLRDFLDDIYYVVGWATFWIIVIPGTFLLIFLFHLAWIDLYG
jgi:hypothetical protein